MKLPGGLKNEAQNCNSTHDGQVKYRLMQQKFVFFKWEYFFPKSNNVTIVTIRKNAEVAAEKNEAAESNAANTLFLWYSIIGYN